MLNGIIIYGDAFFAIVLPRRCLLPCPLDDHRRAKPLSVKVLTGVHRIFNPVAGCGNTGLVPFWSQPSGSSIQSELSKVNRRDRYRSAIEASVRTSAGSV